MSPRATEPLHFQLDVLGDRLINRRLLGIAGRTVKARPAFMAITAGMEALEDFLYDTQGGIGAHGPWTPLKLGTVTVKRKKGLDPRIEIATGATRRSLISSGNPGAIREAFDTWMRFGTRVEDARWQQQGTRKMPARKLIDFREEDKVIFVKEIQRYVMGYGHEFARSGASMASWGKKAIR